MLQPFVRGRPLRLQLRAVTADAIFADQPLNRIGIRQRNHAAEAHAGRQQIATVIGRVAGTVSSRSEEIDRNTRRLASSGSHGSIDCSSRSLQSSTRIVAATAVMGLVIEAMRKIVSRVIAAGWPIDMVPSDS